MRVGLEAIEAAQTAGSARWRDLALVNLSSARLFAGEVGRAALQPRRGPPRARTRRSRPPSLMYRSAIALGRGEPVTAPRASSEVDEVQLLLDLETAQARSVSDNPGEVGALAVRGVQTQIGIVGLVQDLFLFQHVALEALLAVHDVGAMADLLAVIDEAGGRRPIAVSGVPPPTPRPPCARTRRLDAVEAPLRGALDDARAGARPCWPRAARAASGGSWSTRAGARRPSRSWPRPGRSTSDWLRMLAISVSAQAVVT